MDTITIEDFEIRTRIGMSDAERASKQRILISVSIPVDAKTVAASDDVTVGIDYAAVAETIEHMSKTERKTIERLAEDIASALLRTFPIKNVTVTVKKFALPGAKETRLTITR